MLRRVVLCHIERMNKQKISTEAIGSKLVEAAKESTGDVLPLSTKLFPYIFIASRKMSLRAISRWLEDKHGVSLSAAAISRALTSPKVHLERLAESIAPPARYVATLYDFRPMELLFYKQANGGQTKLEYLAFCTEPSSEEDHSRWDEMQELASVWNPIPHEVQLLLHPFLNRLLADPDLIRAEEESPEA